MTSRARLVLMHLAACLLVVESSVSAGAGAGDADVVELASGLTLRGNLTKSSLKLTTRFGQFDASTDDLQTLVCRQPLRIRQTLSTRGGDILVGKLQDESLHFTTADGKAFDLKLSQINQLTTHTNAAPATMSTQPAPNSAAAAIDSIDGDRIAIDAPASIDFRTRRGVLSFKSDQVYEIIFDAPGETSHRIMLTDGSALRGFVVGDSLTVQPKRLTSSKLKVPIGAVSRFEFTSSACVGVAGPRLVLVGGDVLRGALQGTVTLQTELGAYPIAGDDIQSIAAVAKSPGELAVLLTDGRTITWSPEEASAVCKLACGANITFAADTIASYVKSSPAFVQLSAKPHHSRGLNPLLSDGDAMYTIEEQDGIRCWRAAQNRYLYFAIDEKLRPWPHEVTEIEIDYFDSGTGDLSAEYDSTDPAAPFSGAYKTAAVAQRRNTERWQTAHFRITDVRFSGAQNMHADFRIQHPGDDVLVREVRVRRGLDSDK